MGSLLQVLVLVNSGIKLQITTEIASAVVP